MFQKSDLQFDEQDVHVYSPQEFRVNDEVIVFFIGRSIPGQIRQKNNRSGMMKVELHTSMWEERLVDVRAHTHLEPLLTRGGCSRVENRPAATKAMMTVCRKHSRIQI